MSVKLEVAVSAFVDQSLLSRVKADIIASTQIDEIDTFPLRMLDDPFSQESLSFVLRALEKSCNRQGALINFIIGGNPDIINQIRDQNPVLVESGFPRDSALGLITMPTCGNNLRLAREAANLIVNRFPPAPPPPASQLIDTVQAVQISKPHGNQLNVLAHGVVNSQGWTQAELVQQTFSPPADGIYIYDFMARPAASPQPLQPTPIVASLAQALPQGIQGVCVRAQHNEIVERFQIQNAPQTLTVLTTLAMLRNQQIQTLLDQVAQSLNLRVNDIGAIALEQPEGLNAIKGQLVANIPMIDVLFGGSREIHQNLAQAGLFVEQPQDVGGGVLATVSKLSNFPVESREYVRRIRIN